MGKFIEPKHRNLLLASNFLTTDEQYQSELSIIQKDPDKEEVTLAVRDNFNKHMAGWIQQSMKEWGRDPQKYEYKIGRDLPQGTKCQLCGTNLPKKAYSVVNKYNQKKFLIGESCLSHVLRGTVILGHDYSAEQQKRSETLEQKFPELFEFINFPPSKKTKYELPETISGKEKRLLQTAKDYVSSYVKHETDVSFRVTSLLETEKILETQIDAFNNDANDRENFSIKLRRRIARTSSSRECDKIAKIVRVNYGKINTEAAALIFDGEFQSSYPSYVIDRNSLRGIMRGISQLKASTFELTFHCDRNDMDLSFQVKSNDVIRCFGYPNPTVTDSSVKSLITNISDPELSGADSREKAIYLGLQLMKNNGFTKNKVEYNEFKHFVLDNQYDDDKKIQISHGKFENMMSHLIIMGEADKYNVIENKELETLGKDYFLNLVAGKNMQVIPHFGIKKESMFNKLFDRYVTENGLG